MQALMRKYVGSGENAAFRLSKENCLSFYKTSLTR
jgi:hypothetical protein